MSPARWLIDDSALSRLDRPEVEGLTVLHYDADFDVIAEITGQSCEWVVPRGSI